MTAPKESHTFAWTDLLWLAFLGGLAVCSPLFEVHKQETLLAIGLFQIFEHRLLDWRPSRGKYYSVIIKILLATLLVDHTGGINSSYYLIYFLPVVTAAMFFDGIGTLIWTAVTSATYCSLLFPALGEYELSPEGATELVIRNLFFFVAALASLKALKTASVPELTNRILSIEGNAFLTRIANSVSKDEGAPKVNPFLKTRRTPFSTDKSTWPKISGPQDPTKSR